YTVDPRVGQAGHLRPSAHDRDGRKPACGARSGGRAGGAGQYCRAALHGRPARALHADPLGTRLPLVAQLPVPEPLHRRLHVRRHLATDRSRGHTLPTAVAGVGGALAETGQRAGDPGDRGCDAGAARVACLTSVPPSTRVPSATTSWMPVLVSP